MKPLYSDHDFATSLSRGKLPLECQHCGKCFMLSKHQIQTSHRPKHHKANFCSPVCAREHTKIRITCQCSQCNHQFERIPADCRSKHLFCSQSCAAKWNNAHKTKGTRVSKLEVWLSKQLPLLYPSFEFHFNRKDAIDSELDIYIPSLKLAFELNGIFHYEPIYGPDKLSSIQSNDNRKFQACLEKGIELCIIDVSTFKHFKENRALKFLNIIKNISTKR